MSAMLAVILASLAFVAGWAIGRFDLAQRGRRTERRSAGRRAGV